MFRPFNVVVVAFVFNEMINLTGFKGSRWALFAIELH